MKRVQGDLVRDLEEEETNEEAMLGEHEELWAVPDESVVHERRQCELLLQELDQLKLDYTGLSRDTISSFTSKEYASS